MLVGGAAFGTGCVHPPRHQDVPAIRLHAALALLEHAHVVQADASARPVGIMKALGDGALALGIHVGGAEDVVMHARQPDAFGPQDAVIGDVPPGVIKAEEAWKDRDVEMA